MTRVLKAGIASIVIVGPSTRNPGVRCVVERLAAVENTARVHRHAPGASNSIAAIAGRKISTRERFTIAGAPATGQSR